MGISVMEDERGHIQKVIDSFKQTFTELGYLKAWLPPSRSATQPPFLSML